MILRIAALALAMALIPAPAGAKVAVTQSCSENVPPVATAPLTAVRGGAVRGRVELHRDTCHQYWAYLKLNAPVPDMDSRATAVLVVWEDGIQQPGYTCNSTGGNGYIVTGQTSCRTGKVSWVLIDGFQATAHYDTRVDDGQPWYGIATGRTVKVPGSL
ncbi:hypothetical protein ACQHIV_32970 [Kribbella sp. GL6]|uniref:hypothetical protein n=1 Tax=Kribbella sp. GL6 TaxID=3419765 RepID=UPI003D03D2D9